MAGVSRRARRDRHLIFPVGRIWVRCGRSLLLMISLRNWGSSRPQRRVIDALWETRCSCVCKENRQSETSSGSPNPERGSRGAASPPAKSDRQYSAGAMRQIPHTPAALRGLTLTNPMRMAESVRIAFSNAVRADFCLRSMPTATKRPASRLSVGLSLTPLW